MNKYIDASKLIHDLEERILAYLEGYAEGDAYRKDAIETLLKDVKYQLSFQQEQPEVDLDEEIYFWIEGGGLIYPMSNKEKNNIKDTARHFYELGRKQVLQEIYDGKTKPVDKITAAWIYD